MKIQKINLLKIKREEAVITLEIQVLLKASKNMIQGYTWIS
jgi:hypothetical protein